MIIHRIEDDDIRQAKRQHQTKWRHVLSDFYKFSISLHNNLFVYLPKQARSHWTALVWSKRYYHHKRKPGYKKIVNTIISQRVLHTPPWNPEQISCAQRVKQGWVPYYAVGHA